MTAALLCQTSRVYALPENNYLLENVNTMTIVSPGSWVSYRFQAKNSAPVTSVCLYFGAMSGTHNCALTIFNDSAGNPGAAIYGTSSFAPTATGWFQATISSPVALSAGVTYHLVVSNSTNVVSCGPNVTTPFDSIYPLDGSSDPAANVLYTTNSGSTWAVDNFNPVYVLMYNTGATEGYSYATNNLYSVYGTGSAVSIEVSEKFVNPTVRTEQSLALRMKEVGTNTAPVSYQLIDLSGPTTLQSGQVAAQGSIGTTAFKWVTVGFAPQVTLNAGATYRLAIDSITTGSSNYYELAAPDCAAPNSAISITLQGLTYDGTNSMASASANGGGAWTDQPNRDISFAFIEAATATPTNTPASTPTFTPTLTPTYTPTYTLTNSPTNSPTFT
ncbi:MAG TPA: choice-of-anchor R domain-containing protein, partial [bacterium]|nr:choice-of-anchor R domain-containing protein [bacterium]